MVFHTSCNDSVMDLESPNVEIKTRAVDQRVQNLIQHVAFPISMADGTYYLNYPIGYNECGDIQILTCSQRICLRYKIRKVKIGTW